tara:strand:+ start:916 stop:1062 length:147 start_codon:yes stop_codon:yes gene_type:complete
MPIHRRKWWIREINGIVERQQQEQEKVVRMPQAGQAQSQSLRARDVGR